MFKKIETVWNAHTPVYLHNRTKENVIFQLTLTGAIIAAWYAYDVVKARRQAVKNDTDENTYYLSDYAEQR